MCQEKRKHWKEIDFLYSVGILLVTIGHSHSSDWTSINGSAFERVILFIYTFHMPLFFFISGFLFQNSDALEKDGFWKWIKKKAVRLLTPYYFWSLIAAIPKQYFEEGVINEASIVATFIYPRSSVWGHFWFLPVLFLVYLVSGLAKTYHKEKALFIVSIILYFLPFNTDFLGFSDLSNSLIFFCIGMLFNFSMKIHKWLNVYKSKKIVYCIVVTTICFLLTNLAYRNTFVGLCVALLMISVCWAMSNVIEVGNWISNHHFTIYLFSWFFQAIIMMMCGGLHWIPTFLIMFTAGITGPLLVILVYKKLSILHKPIIQILLGVHD